MRTFWSINGSKAKYSWLHNSILRASSCVKWPFKGLSRTGGAATNDGGEKEGIFSIKGTEGNDGLLHPPGYLSFRLEESKAETEHRLVPGRKYMYIYVCIYIYCDTHKENSMGYKEIGIRAHGTVELEKMQNPTPQKSTKHKNSRRSKATPVGDLRT